MVLRTKFINNFYILLLLTNNILCFVNISSYAAVIEKCIEDDIKNQTFINNLEITKNENLKYNMNISYSKMSISKLMDNYQNYNYKKNINYFQYQIKNRILSSKKLDLADEKKIGVINVLTDFFNKLTQTWNIRIENSNFGCLGFIEIDTKKKFDEYSLFNAILKGKINEIGLFKSILFFKQKNGVNIFNINSEKFKIETLLNNFSKNKFIDDIADVQPFPKSKRIYFIQQKNKKCKYSYAIYQSPASIESSIKYFYAQMIKNGWFKKFESNNSLHFIRNTRECSIQFLKKKNQTINMVYHKENILNIK